MEMSRLGSLITMSWFALHGAGIPVMVGAVFFWMGQFPSASYQNEFECQGFASSRANHSPARVPNTLKAASWLERA